MKKLVLLGAVLALAIAATAGPAIAQDPKQTFSERRITSGKASPSDTFSNKGDNVNACPTVEQDVNTGNIANEQGLVQYVSKAGDVGFDGSTMNITPSETANCTQTLEQAAAAGPKAEAKAGKAEAKAPEAKAEAPKAEAKAPKAEAKAELPKTGGVAGTASLLGLGAGALLVSGGLLARKAIR